MGLFFAAKGFTGPALDAAHLLRPVRVLLFDQADIRDVIRASEPNLVQAVRSKWKAVIMTGRSNFPLAKPPGRSDSNE